MDDAEVLEGVSAPPTRTPTPLSPSTAPCSAPLSRSATGTTGTAPPFALAPGAPAPPRVPPPPLALALEPTRTTAATRTPASLRSSSCLPLPCPLLNNDGRHGRPEAPAPTVRPRPDLPPQGSRHLPALLRLPRTLPLRSPKPRSSPTPSARCWPPSAPPSPPPSGDMDALDDVGDPAGARVERGRGSIHNGVADQALANPDMSIAEILFASPRLLLWRLTMWCAALPWRAAYVAACVARAPYRAPRAGSTTVAVLRLLSSWTATMSSLTASPSRSRPSASPSCETRS